jgi:transcription termination/antitermination protein NusA
MISDLARIIDVVQREKNIPRDSLIEVLEQAMVAAARKRFGPDREIEAEYNEDLGEVELFEFRTVVDEIEHEDLEVLQEHARIADPECEVGDSLGIKMPLEDLGRIAAQTAKQVIIQKIRDAEREITFNEFKDRKGELITGIVRRFEKGNIIVDLGRAEAILPKREQVMTETYRQGDRIQAYVLDITRASKSPQVVLSRTHPGLLMKLFELEVPEIYEGIVRIEACAREPGHRAKIAVSSMDRDVDPVGACVGLKGSRVQAVVAELKGEAIDIIPFHPDPARFIVHAISPAQVSRVYIDEMAHSMELIVPDDQLSKAIGRRGQNVRLAAQLTGWRIDIFSETRHAEMVDNARIELARIDKLDGEQVEELIRHGFRSAQELFDAEAYELANILEIEEDAGEDIIDTAEEVLNAIIIEDRERTAREAAEAIVAAEAAAEAAAAEAARPPEADGDLPPDADGDLPPDADGDLPPDADGDLPPEADDDLPPEADDEVPPEADLPPEAEGPSSDD